MISIDDFKKVEITIGKIVSAVPVEGSDKLLKLSVDFNETNEDGTPKHRQVISGIAKWNPDPNLLVGKKTPFVTNLEVRSILGLESQAMILAAGSKETNSFSLLGVDDAIPQGTKLS
jgi:methionyl-tRNA synthetase